MEWKIIFKFNIICTFKTYSKLYFLIFEKISLCHFRICSILMTDISGFFCLFLKQICGVFFLFWKQNVRLVINTCMSDIYNVQPLKHLDILKLKFPTSWFLTTLPQQNAERCLDLIPCFTVTDISCLAESCN